MEATLLWPSAKWSSLWSSLQSSWWISTSRSKWSTGSGAWVQVYVSYSKHSRHTVMNTHMKGSPYASLFCVGSFPCWYRCSPVHHHFSDLCDRRVRGRCTYRRRGEFISHELDTECFYMFANVLTLVLTTIKQYLWLNYILGVETPRCFLLSQLMCLTNFEKRLSVSVE